jgi:hypothetical protein
MARLALLFFVAVITCIPELSLAYSNNYASIGGGSGGSSEAGNLSIEGGVVRPHQRLGEYIVGIGATIIYTGDAPDGLIDCPVSHTEYVTLGKRVKDQEYGFYGKYGFSAIYNKLYVFGIAGFTIYEEVEVVQSTATGWYFTQSSEEKMVGLAGGGLAYFFGGIRGKCLQVEYDTRRGITGSIGLTW